MEVSINARDLEKGEGKVQRFGIFDDCNTCVKICLTKEEAEGIAAKWSVPHPFGFADEHIDYSAREIWV